MCTKLCILDITSIVKQSIKTDFCPQVIIRRIYLEGIQIHTNLSCGYHIKSINKFTYIVQSSNCAYILSYVHTVWISERNSYLFR
jgi:hypothetical protein